MNIIILDEIEWEYIQEAVVEQSITTLNESQWKVTGQINQSIPVHNYHQLSLLVARKMES